MAIGTAVAAQACPQTWPSDEPATLHRMVELREKVGVYTATHGRPPESLAEACAGTSTPSCDWLEPEREFPDGWGTPLEYRLAGTGPELRSAGRDRRLRTADDLVFTAEAEQQRLLRLTGCYTLTLPRSRLTFPVQLDTTSSTAGWHRLRKPAPSSGGIWSAAVDRIYLRIIEAPHIWYVVLPVGRDTVMGYGDVGGVMQEVVAVRADCAPS